MPPTFRPATNIEYAAIESYHTFFNSYAISVNDIGRRRLDIILPELCHLTELHIQLRKHRVSVQTMVMVIIELKKCGAYIILKNGIKVNLSK